MLRIPRETLEELAREFPDDIGRALHDMALSGRRNMARMRWQMVWGKHRLQVGACLLLPIHRPRPSAPPCTRAKQTAPQSTLSVTRW